MRNLEQLRWKSEKLHLLLLFPRLPSPLSTLGGVRNQDWQTKQEQKAQSEEKSHGAPFPTGFLLATGRAREWARGRSSILSSAAAGFLLVGTGHLNHQIETFATYRLKNNLHDLNQPEELIPGQGMDGPHRENWKGQ